MAKETKMDDAVAEKYRAELILAKHREMARDIEATEDGDRVAKETQMDDAEVEGYLEALRLAKQQAMVLETEKIESQADLVFAFYNKLKRNGMPEGSATHLTGCYILAETSEAKPVGILQKYGDQWG